jgi:hypothetical protein
MNFQITNLIIRSLAILLAVFLMTACAGPQQFYSPPSLPFSRPAVGVVTVAYLGDPLLTQGVEREYDAIDLPNRFSVGAFVLPAGKYLKATEDSISERFSWDEISNPTRGGVVSDGQILKNVILLKGRPSVIVSTFSSRVYAENSHPFQRIKTVVQDQGSFQQTLLYSGRVGNKISFSYREFSNQSARTAFTNSAEYDLSESKIIGYKGAQIEVIEATNQTISYRVIRNFNDLKQ